MSTGVLVGRPSARTAKDASPRLRRAVRYYYSGIARTKAQAARMAGLEPITLYTRTMPSAPDPRLDKEIKMAEAMNGRVEENVSRALVEGSVEAIRRMRSLLDSSSEIIQFKAAQDLADRGPLTSKVTKLQSTHLSLDGQDAQALASALVESRRQSLDGADGDFVKVVDVADQVVPLLPTKT